MKEWVYGRNAVYETLRAKRRRIYSLKLAEGVQPSPRLQEIQSLARAAKLNVQTVRRGELDGYVDGHHQGVALQVEEYPYAHMGQLLQRARDTGKPPFFLILDTLQDPQNFGTLLRTAEAVGVHGIIIPQRRTATVTPAVVNASSGATEHLLIAQHNLAQAIDELKQEDIWVIGLDGGPQSQPLGRLKLDMPITLVVGSEGEGMRRLVRESCDGLLRLPMQGRVESLNAATAGSVALYMVWQARGFEAG
ncbi:MAG TPA: 23S rRNA (guanosine(2251)-2'-O)-methyltransferase RlmB [Anaerolineales bacterium]|nr:23S rRNA (guanosine(2251)-2'-O)-methyltransferase RlmB [Anaerolineales bacterium]HRQ93338.1 23S rRNA (guanosine(2251)-2'-O)-methyltransferase RlmB [Anaerolineales bacterium]